MVYNPFTIKKYSQLASSNNEAMRIAVIDEADEFTVVVCDDQTAGRGQRNNNWESEAGKNLTFSLVLRPCFMEPEQLFFLSKAFSVSVCQVIRKQANIQATIKWPNDLYVGNKKIAGILLEHSFSGNRLLHSVIGLGMNVNQELFLSDAPNPTSLILECGSQFSIDNLLTDILLLFHKLYKNIEKGDIKNIENEYLELLFSKEGYHKYRLPSGHEFYARIIDVLNSGTIILEQPDGIRHSFAFKEVSIVI